MAPLARAGPPPERLFEAHTVEALADYARSLRAQVEGKREELRTMVGERYRDLLEAADTIADMRAGARALTASLATVVGRSRASPWARVAGPPPAAGGVSDPHNGPYLALAAEIQCLMLCPERIWSQVERGHFGAAAQLYLLARHVHTGLSLEREGGAQFSAQTVAARFPVVARQWASLGQLREAIWQGAQATATGLATGLATDERPLAAVLEALLARALLQGYTAEALCGEFLRGRQAAWRTAGVESGETAAGLLSRALRLIRSSLAVVHRAFAGGGQLAALARAWAASPTLERFEWRSSPILQYLPPVVRQFRPSLVLPLEPLSREHLQRTLTVWLDQMHELLLPEIRGVLAHVHSLAGLIALRRSLGQGLAEMPAEAWHALCADLLGQRLCLWDEFYRSAFRERVESLVAARLAAAVASVRASVDDGPELSGERDLSPFLWAESAVVDLAHWPGGLLGPSPAPGSAQRLSGLALKARGYSPRVLALCEQWDGQLAQLWSEVRSFVAAGSSPPAPTTGRPAGVLAPPSSRLLDSERSASPAAPFDPAQDHGPILDCMQQSTLESLAGLLAHWARPPRSPRPGELLFLARFYQALPELCPHLARCVLAPTSLARASTDFEPLPPRPTLKVDPQWAGVRAQLAAASCALFQEWITSLMLEFRTGLLAQLERASRKKVHLFAQWETIEISERGEDETTPVQSTIRVPQHPSIALLCALGQFCGHVYGVAPYSLPPAVLESLSQEPAQVMASVYAQMADQEATLDQNVALQLHFDLQFVLQAIVARENTPTLDSLERTVHTLEAKHIDPFDLRVFLPYMSVNVKRSILREQGLINALIPNDRYTLLASMKSTLPPAPTPGTAAQESHNAIWSLPPRQAKIPLMPIPKKVKTLVEESASLSVRDANLSARSVSPVLGRRKRDKSPVARAAGSFFEAMSTSWFGPK